jgi:cold shock CspA family protein
LRADRRQDEVSDIRRIAGVPEKSRAEAPTVVVRGHVARLSVGQGCGFIRMADGRDIWFHRGDIGEYAGFNDLAVGDSVTFDLLEDRISGARALRVRRN